MRIENRVVIAQKGSSLENSIADFKEVVISAGVSRNFYFFSKAISHNPLMNLAFLRLRININSCRGVQRIFNIFNFLFLF